MYDVGDTYPASLVVRDGDGEPVDATGVTFTFTLPDGTTDAPVTPAHPSTGHYTYDFPITEFGLHRVRMVATDPAQATVDAFTAVGADWPALVGLAEVKEHLNIAATVTTYDEELRGFILSASEVVEGIVGSVSRRAITETHSGRGRGAIMLRERPALAITEVTENGSALTGGFSLSDAGVLFRTSGYAGARWADGVNNITVTYQAGRQAVPWAVLDGTKELIRLNWRPQTGGSGSVFNQGGDAGPGEVRLGFFIPNTVMQRLQPSATGPMVA